MSYFLIYECPICGYKTKVTELNKDNFHLYVKHSELKGVTMKKFKCDNCWKTSKLYIEKEEVE